MMMTETMLQKTPKAETDIGAQVETITHDVKKLGRMAGRNAKRRLTEARDRGGQMVGQVRTKTRRAVEHRPWAVLAAAVGMGALVGVMLARK